LESLPDGKLQPGPLKGLLFGSPGRFITDLVMQLRMKAALCEFCAAARSGANLKESFKTFVSAIDAWQRRHGYENAMGLPGLSEALQKLNSPDINAVLNTQFTVEVGPPPDWKGTSYEFTHKILGDTESYTPRLIAAMKKALEKVP